MAGVSVKLTPAELAQRLEELDVRVESASVERRAVPLPDYPGGPRPSSVVRLSGLGCQGVAENVAFYDADHERFTAHVERWFASLVPTSPRALGPEGTPYERAALEAALIDLGLRQAKLSLFDLTGVREASLRFVVSLAAESDPRAAIERLFGEGYRGELKVDVDPSWSPRVLDALAADPRIAIFDFKGRGDATLARRLFDANASAWFEDPPADFAAARISRDATIADPGAVAQARARGEAVNLKAPRMGGPLAVLRGLEQALPAVPAYLGGMFEVGVGRQQARELAALFCASAPNDLALNSGSSERAASPAAVRFDRPGFGNG